MTRVAVLGLGAMGSRMAVRLLEAGHAVTVWNRSAAAADALVARGARSATTPRLAVAGAELVLSMVTDDDASRSVWVDPGDGAIGGLARGALAVESSTVSPAWVTELADRLTTAGARPIDAPVAGSRPQAESGTLIFMAGGEVDAIDAARPLLAPLAAAVHRAGPSGHGALLKLAVNTLFAAQLASVAELIGFLAANGFARAEAAELLGRFPVASAPAAAAAKSMATGDGPTRFTIDLLAKDLGYLAKTAAAAGADLPSASRTREVFDRARAAGLGGADISALGRLFA